jgi:hypothetical protein
VLRLGIFLAGELEESRGRHNAAIALVEAASFRAEIEDGRAAWTGRREAEPHRGELDAVLGGAHHRPEIVYPDVVRLRQVSRGLPRRDAEHQRLHHLAVFGPGDVLFIVVAHDRQDRAARVPKRGLERDWTASEGDTIGN